MELAPSEITLKISDDLSVWLMRRSLLTTPYGKHLIDKEIDELNWALKNSQTHSSVAQT